MSYYRVFSHTVENDNDLRSYNNLARKTASQLQRFLGHNKGPGILLRMRQEAVPKQIRGGLRSKALSYSRRSCSN
jgi:hypothetical protein